MRRPSKYTILVSLIFFYNFIFSNHYFVSWSTRFQGQVHIGDLVQLRTELLQLQASAKQQGKVPPNKVGVISYLCQILCLICISGFATDGNSVFKKIRVIGANFLVGVSHNDDYPYKCALCIPFFLEHAH